jgi:hypothetical protein
MSDTRRNFFHAAAAVAAGLGGAANVAAQARGPQTPAPAAGPGQGQGRGGRGQQPAGPPKPVSEVQVPKMKFGKAEISRLICGCNEFYGFSHFNSTLDTVMQEYYTQERVCDVLHQCNRFGINAFNYYSGGRGQPDFEAFLAEGGNMHLIVQGNIGDQTEFIKKFKPLAIYYQGDQTDRAYHNDQMDTVKEWCKKMRDTGSMVGVGSHNPEVIALVEERNWDVDFYACCVYNRTRTQDEWAKVLGDERVEGEGYVHGDPPKMYKVIQASRKPCFAFKILAAGRVTNVDQAFRTAYQSIKPTDGVFIGLWPRVRDQVRENAERVHRLLVSV